MNKTWKIIIRVIVVIIAIIILVVGGFWLWLTHEGSTKDIEAVANQFQPGSSWVETARRVEPPRNACIGDNPCPSLSRSWRINHVVSKDELMTLLKKSNWDFPIQGECQIAADSNSEETICSAEGSIRNYTITVRVEGASSQPTISTARMEVR